MDEMFYCFQCREIFFFRLRFCKNGILEEMVNCFIQVKGQVLGFVQNLVGFTDVFCDFCFFQKFKLVKLCLQCMVFLCEKYLRSYFEDQVFQDYQLLEFVWDFKSRLCRKYRKLQRLYCRIEGCCVCGVCLLEEYKNYDIIFLEEERVRKEVGVGGQELGDLWF